VVDLLEEHRLLLRRDPAGEAPAERDPDALAHLLLDAAGRRGHEVLPRRVEQEDGGGVDDQEVAHPVEHLDEELLDAEARERGVGDSLDAAQAIVHRSVCPHAREPNEPLCGAPARRPRGVR
jgi:hypothetical protein